MTKTADGRPTPEPDRDRQGYIPDGHRRSSRKEGRVEVRQADSMTWGTVCHNQFDIKDADVVCKMLGYPSAQLVRNDAYFGPETATIRYVQARARGDTGWLPALAVGSHDVLPRAAARTQTYRRIPPTGRRPEFHEIGAGWLGNDPVGIRRHDGATGVVKTIQKCYKHNARTDRFLHQRYLYDPPTHRLWETQITLMIDKERAGHFPPAGAPGTISTGRRRSTEEFTGELGWYGHQTRQGKPAAAAGLVSVDLYLEQVNLRHAARDTLLFYTGHRCRHIFPVCAKLPAPANDAGFRTVETISVHGEGFSKLRHVHPEMQTTTGIHWLA
ncbi:scavenger receptor [Branchiostoma belcheri]|nr:scavenger receptor [Branchiostoma belcheri]